MSQASSSQSPSPGGFDFELTDLDAARAALDELPAGVQEVHQLEPGFWDSRRRRPTPADRALTGSTMDWFMALPPGQRPKTLCEQFPRVANAVADCWPDAQRCLSVLDSLVVDRRGRRRGFPPEVASELRALREFRVQASSGGMAP